MAARGTRTAELKAVRQSGVDIWNDSVEALLIVSAKILKLAAPRGISTWEARLFGLPVSATSAARKSSKRRMVSSATASRRATRSLTDIVPHGPSLGARAAATAPLPSGLAPLLHHPPPHVCL